MVAYNFQKQFAVAVERGEKTQTIRAIRKTRHALVGEPVQLYTGMRTKACRKLVDPDPFCVLSVPLVIQRECIFVDGALMDDPVALDQFARADGFEDFAALRDWFRRTHGLTFFGWLIGWEPSARDSGVPSTAQPTGDK